MLIFSTSAISSPKEGSLFEITLRNILTAQVVKYEVIGNRIEIFKGKNEGKMHKIFGQVMRSRTLILLDSISKEIMDNSEVENSIVLSNPYSLDGFCWTFVFKDDISERKIEAYNCLAPALDKLILFLNNNIKEKHRLIFPMSDIFKSSPCQ